MLAQAVVTTPNRGVKCQPSIEESSSLCFGDTHPHTSCSTDAGMVGTFVRCVVATRGPEDFWKRMANHERKTVEYPLSLTAAT
jgi:hypothetical protein